MTPNDEDRRWRDGVTSAIAALQAGEKHSIEDRETLRREIRESEARLAGDLAGVGQECRDFRVEVRHRWEADERARKEREKEAAEIAQRLEERQDRLKLTTMQRVGLAIAATGPVLAAVGMVVK